ncbi:MAG: ATP-binding protein [Methylococcales bacterium]
MIQRQLLSELLQSAKDYSVVTVIGPRQAGKTTLVKMAFPEYDYCNLENPEIRDLAQSDPNALFSRYSGKCIFDEIQRVPELLSYIQVKVDENEFDNKGKGRYILTGSHQLQLHQSISQSLAGRTAILKLLPLSISELTQNDIEIDKFEIMYRGFLPRIYKDNINPTRLYRNYYETYVERDVRQLINLKDLSTFTKFIKLLAGRVGQIVNLSSMANDTGVSSNTLKSWLAVLEASFIIFKLEPYFENFGKRVIKSPKIYFTDIGLLIYLLGIEKPSQIERDPLYGSIFENLVITEALKARYNQGEAHNLYYYRTSKGNELDLIYKKGRELVPIEIKSSMTFHRDFIKGISFFNKLSKSTNKGVVIYSGELVYEATEYKLLNYINTATIFT